MDDQPRMMLKALADVLEGQWLVAPQEDQAVTCGYTCDLLSWVMAHARQGMAWITVQTHMNVIAVAALMELSCVILPEGIQMEQGVLDKAREEGIAVLCSPLTAYALCARMAAKGIPA